MKSPDRSMSKELFFTNYSFKSLASQNTPFPYKSVSTKAVGDPDYARECISVTRDAGHQSCFINKEDKSVSAPRMNVACCGPQRHTLGTAAYRRGEAAKCKTMLIGGYRFPICKNLGRRP